ncbi:MAG: hypothetical protein KBA61_04420 [Spirochaetes bacterium]|nr:hypothetical protein [Spirochaetota bacterium]
MADIEYLRAHDLNYTSLINKMASDYYSYKSWYNKYEYANSKCGSKNPVTRRRWRNNRDHRRNQYRTYYTAYEGSQTQLSSYFLAIIDSRTNLESYQSQLTALDMVRSAGEFRETTLAKDRYSLTTEDRERIHDALDNRTDSGAGDVNINGLRHMAQRKDIDGYAVKVKRVGDTLQVLDREGKVTGSYALGDVSVILTSDEAGSSILAHADLAEGSEAYLTDYVYSSLDVTRALAKTLTNRRAGMKRVLEDRAAASTHDRTVVLRDLESLHHALLLQAASVGTALPATIREAKPRSFDGYAKAVSDLVYDGSGGSVDDRIVNELMAQNNSFQNQNWSFLTETYSQKKQSWMETAAFVRTRGERDWADNLYAVENAWRKWSMETRATIAQDEKDWEKAQGAFAASQERWKATTAVDSADAAAEMLGRDLEADIRASVEAVNAGLPKSLALSFDAESLYRDAMKKAPKADLGALSKSMMAANTTAGFTNMLNLGLSGNLAQSFEKQMQSFENGMSVMKNLRMSEVIYNMLDGFEAQLAEVNKQNYDTVLTGLAVGYEAPFVRNTKGRQWNIRVVEDYSLTDTNYHTIRFADYQNFVNSTVKMKSLRSLNGGAVDFSDPTSYNMIDARELEMYVRLETDHLNKEIEKVFGGTDGLFQQHSTGEFARLQNEFNSAYSDYLAGEAMMGGDWYRTPIFKNGPDPMTVAKVGAAVAAGPWAAFAVTAILLTVDAKDGMISGRQALMQGGVGFASSFTGGLGGLAVNMAASGIDYEQDGGMGWDNDKFREGAIRNAASYVLSSSLGGAFKAENSTWGTGLSQGLSAGLMNGVQISSSGWGDLDLDYDKANWREHMVTGAASGITAMVTKAMSGKGNTGSERSQANNPNGMSSYPEQWGSVFGNAGVFDTQNAFTMKAISGGINSMLMTAAYHALGGKGFKNDYSDMNWNNMIFSAYDLGNFQGAKANELVKSQSTTARNAADWSDARTGETGKIWWQTGLDGLAKALEYSDKGDATLRNVFGKIGEYGVKGIAGLGSLAVDGLSAAWRGVTGLFASSPSTGAGRSTEFVEMMKDKSMQKWVMDMMYRDKDFAKIADELGLAPELKKIGMDMNTVESYKENRDKNYSKDGDGILSPKSHREYADYFDAKMRLSKEMGSDYAISLEDKADLVRTVQQKNGASISQELVETIKGSAEYKRILQDKGVSLSNDADIEKYANKIAREACVNANLWVSLKVAGANVESYYGDFYMKSVKRDDLIKDSTGLILNARRDTWGIDYQRVANNYKIDGKAIEVVRGSDFNSFLNDIEKNDVVVRGSWGHNMSIISGNLYDTGLAGRKWGGDPIKFIKDRSFLSSYYYLRLLK